MFIKTRDENENPEWPSEAPSGIDVYTADAIPGWKNSLLLPSLKNGQLVRLTLNNAGNAITGDTICYFKAAVRYRDIAVSPDGKKIYLATDSSAVSSGPSREDPEHVSKRGCILEFAYIGQKQKSEGKKEE